MNHEILLCDLPQGLSASVIELSGDGAIRRRLRDLGLIEGTTVTCAGSSPCGDPHAYLIRGALIAIRREDSRHISVLLSDAPGGDIPWD